MVFKYRLEIVPPVPFDGDTDVFTKVYDTFNEAKEGALVEAINLGDAAEECYIVEVGADGKDRMGWKLVEVTGERWWLSQAAISTESGSIQ